MGSITLRQAGKLDELLRALDQEKANARRALAAGSQELVVKALLQLDTIAEQLLNLFGPEVK